DINEVEWDWQLMTSPDSPDAEVGIFAIKNEVINSFMGHFTREKMQITNVQIGPMALYNYAHFDRQDVREDEGKAVVIMDMGCDSTTLVVCTKDTVWQRSIRIGGNAFTEAIEEAFKLSFRKAEKLKRTAPMSKYMRQIFTAMKPMYTDLGSEVQRSLGFYASSGPGREKGFSKIIALGGGMKLQGLAKYLQQTLNIPVIRPDSYERLTLAPEVSAAKFHENIGDFGIVYGLGVQMLDEPKIKANLLPRRLARQMAWARKAKYFTAAACLLLGVSIVSLANVQFAKAKYNSSTNEGLRRQSNTIASAAREAKAKLEEQKQREPKLNEQIAQQTDMLKYRDIIPKMNHDILACLPNEENNPEQVAVYKAFEEGNVEALKQVPRTERKQLFITSLSVQYVSSVKDADLSKLETMQRKAISISTGGFGYEGMDPRYMEGMDPRYMEGMDPRYMEGTMDPRYREGMYGPGGTPLQTTEKEPDGPGFIVLIEGYSPYHGGTGNDLSPLLDPPGVGRQEDQTNWGFITRLENMGKVVSDTPFKLYEKGNTEHFILEKNPVDLSQKDTPLGIGMQVEKERVSEEILKADTGLGMGRGGGTYYDESMRGGGRMASRVEKETVLVDPLTGEEISKVFDIITEEDIATNPDLTDKNLGERKFDQYRRPKFIVRDHWFRVKCKFLWEGGPEVPKKPVMGGGYRYGR
ncbi:MAG: pilus assembly protein PilM, partial [Sedimentisphaerales bacterium]|nr:pilus assembly protein PilM [Sedimentisphaerales bacterium]